MTAPATPVRFGAEMTIGHAAAHRETLLGALAARPAALELDLSEVTEFDSSAAQLLLAARHSAAQQGLPLQLLATSGEVRAALAVFGIDHLFNASHGA